MAKHTKALEKLTSIPPSSLIICHEPHPQPTVDNGCIADVIEHLKTYGFI